MISIPAAISIAAPRITALVAAGAAVLGVGLVLPATASDDEPRLLAVQFDLTPGQAADDGPLSASGSAEVAHYVALQVDHGGVTRRLRPMTGSIGAHVSAGSTSLAAEIDGLRIGPAADGFDRTMTDVFASTSLSRFARIDTGGVGQAATIDLRLPRPLEPGDYLLVQEAGGDDSIELETIGADGVVIGPTRVVGPPYRWNSGHRTPDGAAQWAVVVPASAAGGTAPATGLRIRSSKAEVKILVMEPAVEGAAASIAGQAAATGPESGPESGADAAPTAISLPPTIEAASTEGHATEAPATGAPVATTAPAETEVAETTPTEAPGTTGHEPSPGLSTDQEPAPTEANSPIADGPAAVEGQAAAEVTPSPSEPDRAAQTDDAAPAPTTLAMTGVPTEPWVLVALATGFIFFGYTAVAAFRRPAHLAGPGESQGHAQLDALGFD